MIPRCTCQWKWGAGGVVQSILSLGENGGALEVKLTKKHICLKIYGSFGHLMSFGKYWHLFDLSKQLRLKKGGLSYSTYPPYWHNMGVPSLDNE